MNVMSAVPTVENRRPEVAAARSASPAGNRERSLNQLIGFGPMSRVSTSFGEVPAQALRERDRVRTKTGEYLEIQKIDRITLDEDFLQYHPGAQPILIRAGALANNIPKADLVLAPYQQIDKSQPCLQASGNRAVDTLHKSHCMRKIEPMITYTIFHCGRPATVNCEGLWIDTAP